MHKTKLKAKIFALLLTICMVGTYMPVHSFAAEEADIPITQFTVEGASDGNILKAVNESGETDLTVDKTGEKVDPAVNEIEGEKLTLNYEVAEGSTLRLKIEGVPEELKDKVFEAGEKGSIEIAGGGSVEAKFEKTEPPAEVKEEPKEEPKEPKEEPKEPKEEESKEEPKEPAKTEEAQAAETEVIDPENLPEDIRQLLREERIRAYGTDGLLQVPTERPLLRAIPSNTTVNYNSSERIFDNPLGGNERGVRRFTTTVDGVSYEGSCAEAGVEAQYSGTATVVRRSNTSHEAKMIYHFVYEKGWWTTEAATNVSPQIPGLYNGWYFPAALCVETMAQAHEMGREAFINGYVSNQFDEDDFIAIYNWIASYDTSGITVPDGFELYYGNAGAGNQNFVVWKYNPYGKVKVKKVKSPASAPYSISGADYWVYTDSACTTRAKDTGGNAIVLTTNASGDTKEVNLTPGKTYYIKEKTAPAHFNLDTAVHSVTITGGQTKTVTSTDTAKYGYMQVIKKASPAFLAEEYPGSYSLAGAVYGVYTDAAATTAAKDINGSVVTLTTKADGTTAVSPAMWIGTYYIKEKTAPASYNLDTTVYKVTLTDNSTKTAPAKVTSTDKVKESYAYLQKTAAETQTDFVSVAPANYSLAGAEYSISDADTDEDALDFDNKPVRFITGRDGKTNMSTILPGAYRAQETKASKGFKLDKKAGKNEIPVTNKNTKNNPAKFTSVEEPVYAPFNFKVEKREPSGDVGWKKLLGAKYEMKYYPVDPDTPLEELSDIEGTRTWIFETKEKSVDGRKFAGIEAAADEPLEGSDAFFMERDEDEDGDIRILPLGVFTIREIEAPKGLAINEKVYVGRVFQPDNGADAEMEVDGVKIDLSNDKPPKVEVLVEDDRQYPTIKLRKTDSEKNEVQGTDRDNVKGSLAGAVYEVWYENPLTNKNEKAGELVTDENGIGRDKDGNDGIWTWQEDGRPGKNKLEMGHYFVKEVTASPGYTVDALYYENNADGSVNENGEHIVVARSKEINANTIEYTVDSLESPHHTIIHKTDITSGEELEGAKLQVIDSEGNIIEEWTSTKEPHDIVALHDETQGLKDGKYTLREITAPYGYDTAEDVEFEVKSGAITNEVEMKNAPIELRTTATSETTDTHVGAYSETEKIRDVVKFKNLYAGREYTFRGILKDKETGEDLLDAEGNAITAEKKFTPQGEGLVSGEVELEFEFDASSIEKFRSVVAFEYVDRAGKELAAHADLEDEDQTVRYGGVAATTAVGRESGSHNVLSGENTVITDKVEYKNLVPGQTYILNGELYDKTAEELTGIIAGTVFVPEEENGFVDVEFDFDATPFEGHTLVVFEELSVRTDDEDVTIDEHKDPEDEDQTVHVPEIRTTAVNTETEDHIAMAKKDIVIVDTVRYRNLIPGREYTVRGKLVYKDNGNDVIIDGEYVEAETTFIPEEYDGEIDLEFRFNAVSIAGRSVVAFEEVLEEGFLVGVHADLEDEDQTVRIPKIGTKAIDSETGANVAVNESVRTIIDTVKYENLIPGREYTMRGYLVLKSTGDAMMADGERITAEKTFTAEEESGTVKLEFKVNAADITGDAVVVFEECYLDEVLVGKHSDVNDEEQSVYVPEIATSLSDAKTGDHIANGSKDVTLVDEVFYRGLTPGKKYTMKGTLMNKQTAKPIMVNGAPLVVEKAFTPEESEGTVELEFRFDGSLLRGQTVVAFEECSYEKIKVAVHADINDEEQSVRIPKISTTIGKKNGKFVTDVVEYRNLIPGRQYIMTGFFVDQKTGKRVKDSGGELKFKAEAANGKVEVKLYPGDSRSKMVAFEYCYIVEDSETKAELVGSHEDINDKAQTYTPSPKTGEDNSLYLYGGIAVVAAALLIFLLRRKK